MLGNLAEGEPGAECDERDQGDDDDDDEEEDDGDDEAGSDWSCRWLFLTVSLGRRLCKRLTFLCFFAASFLAGLDMNEGGGVRGGSRVSLDLTLGVPGQDSHLKGTPTGAPP